MPYIPTTTKEKILQTAKDNMLDILRDYLDILKGYGLQYYAQCPACGKIDKKKKKGVTINPGKEIIKCFSCDFSAKGAINYLTTQENMAYTEALLHVAKKYGIPVEQQENKVQGKTTFRDLQLQESGLTNADQKDHIINEKGEETQIDTFIPGTFDKYSNIKDGSDLVIRYVTLDDKLATFTREKINKRQEYARVRYQFPNEHLDKNGQHIKYKTPWGSETRIYLPPLLRKYYKQKKQFDTLYLQEGEKKAIKATKHGMMSVGLSGINNLAFQKKLPDEFKEIIKTCGVKNVVFVLDADCFDISEKIEPGKAIHLRPNLFFRAVKNFKDYFAIFRNMGIYLEIYFGYVKPEHKQKGIDDLLHKTLKGKEKDLIKDAQDTLNIKDGQGKYLNFHKISAESDQKIKEFWSLESAKALAMRHATRITQALGDAEFKIFKQNWRFNNGLPDEAAFELAQPLRQDEIFWTTVEKEKRNGEVETNHNFDYFNCFRFLSNRGYGRLKMKNGKFELVRLDNNVCEIFSHYDVRDYVVQTAKEIAGKDVVNMLYRGGTQYLGPEKLTNLDYVEAEFINPNRERQYLFFKDEILEITKNNIKKVDYNKVEGQVWKSHIIDKNVKMREKKLFEVTVINDEFLNSLTEGEREKFTPSKGKVFIDFSEEASKCHFLQFLKNTSNFHWCKLKEGETYTEEEAQEITRHLVSKITAFGFMLHAYKSPANAKAVVCMDGKMSEVGENKGRTGKSLYCESVGHVIPQVTIPARSKRLTEDNFLLEEVTERTRSIFFDDLRQNVDFEYFFPLITGGMAINAKFGSKFTLSYKNSPKIIFTTNHAINGSDDSSLDRQYVLAFSDYYNKDHKPIHDFGVEFFEEWDHEQWELFYNFSALALHYYLKYGHIDPPNERVEKRRLRQEIGEDMLIWADSMFNPHSGQPTPIVDSEDESMIDAGLNCRTPRRALYHDYTDYMKKNNRSRYTVTQRYFKKRLKAFCKFRGYEFNPAQGGKEDKSGGVEYFTISNEGHEEK